MNELAPIAPNVIAPMSEARIEQVRKLEALTLKMPQAHIETTHTFHAGMYSRTIRIPAGVMITGALIKIDTTLIVSGDVIMLMDGKPIELHGYNVFQAAAHRKQVFIAQSDTHLTMCFATKATTIEEAEAEFTDEAHMLITNRKES